MHQIHQTSRVLLLGLCTLGSGSLFAQSTVSLSGWLDIGLSKKTQGSTSIGNIGRSNFALTGTEDLGGGLAATFKFSNRFEMDTGAAEASDAAVPFWKGESTVGFKGGYGSIKFGRALTPLWNNSWAYDPWYNFDRIASTHWWQFAPDYLSNPQTREYGRLNDGIFYDSPSLGGFSVHLSTAVDKTATDLGRGMGASFNYDKGDLSLMLGLEKNSQKDKAAFLGAAYTVAGVRVMGSYNFVKLNPDGVIYSAAWTDWAGASKPTTKRTALTLGASYSVGPSTYRLGAGRDFQGATNAFNYIGSTFKNAGTGYSGPSNMYSAGYVYALSKRTSLFADVALTKWKYTDDNGHTSATGYAVGMSHSF